MDRRYVTMETNGDLRVFRIPNNRFLALQFTNISQQTQQSIREAQLQLDIQYNEDRILEILNAALEFVCRNNSEFTGWFRNYVTQVQTGSVTYKIRYECSSEFSGNQSKHLVLKSVLRFLKSSGISLESSILVQSVPSLHSSHFPPLQNVYPFGILKVLSEEEVVKLSENAISLHYNAGQQIITRGEMADSMYIIAEGILEVVTYKENGDKVILASLWPGDCVGEMSLLTGEPRSADVFARDNAHLIEIRKQDLAPILQANPILVERISSLLAMRLAQNEKTLSLANQQEAVNERRQSLAKKILNFFAKL
jgi:CRP-like cAMP-binding protein